MCRKSRRPSGVILPLLALNMPVLRSHSGNAPFLDFYNLPRFKVTV